MNNNMIKVLAVVVIAGGLWWFLKVDGDGKATHSWVAAHCSDAAITVEADCVDPAKWVADECKAN